MITEEGVQHKNVQLFITSKTGILNVTTFRENILCIDSEKPYYTKKNN